MDMVSDMVSDTSNLVRIWMDMVSDMVRMGPGGKFFTDE